MTRPRAVPRPPAPASHYPTPTGTMSLEQAIEVVNRLRWLTLAAEAVTQVPPDEVRGMLSDLRSQAELARAWLDTYFRVGGAR